MAREDIKVRIGGDISGLDNALRGASGRISQFASMSKASFASMAATGATIGLAMAAITVTIASATAAFRRGFNAVESYNQSVASLGAMVMTFAKKQPGESQAEQWEKAYQYSSSMVPVLENLAAKTLLSGQETTALAEAFARSGVFLDANNAKQMESFTRISNALPLMTKGQQIMMQINQEIRGLMSGVGIQNSMLLQTMKAIDPEIKKHLATWRAEGTILEHIGDLLSGFGPATKLLENQWQTVKSTLETTVTQILRGLFRPAYEKIIELTQNFNDLLVRNKQTVIDWGLKFRIVLVDIQAEIIRMGMLLDKVGGTMTTAQMFLYGPGSALGFESSEKRFENAAKDNMEYERLYNEKDKMLQRLAKEQMDLEAQLRNPKKPGTTPSPPKGGGAEEPPPDKAAQRHAELVKKTFNDLLKQQMDYEFETTQLDNDSWEKKRQEVFHWAETIEKELIDTGKYSTNEIAKFSSQIEQTGLTKLKLIDAEKIREEIDQARELYKKYTDDINQMTMSEKDYKLDALQTETIAMTVKFIKEKDLINMIQEHYKVAAANIIAESDRSSQAWLKDQLKKMQEQGATTEELMQAQWDHELRYTTDANRGIAIALEQRTDKYKAEAQKMHDITTQLADVMESSITDGFMGIIKGTEDVATAFKNMASAVIDEILKIIIQEQIARPIANMASGVISGMVGMAAVAHSGGIVGSTSFPKRTVLASTFIGAPRLHKGLGSDEYPAILQRGERVVSKGQSGSGGQTVQYINNFDGAIFMDQAQLGNTIRTISSQQVYKLAPDAVFRNYNDDGPMRHMVKKGV